MAVLVTPEPAPDQGADGWLRVASPVGTADAVYRKLPTIEAQMPRDVVVCVGSGVGGQDYDALLATHRARRLGVTVGCVEVPAESAKRCTVLGVDTRGRVVRIADRPQRPQGLPHDAARALVSTDIYVFDLEALIDCLSVDAADPTSTHDLRRDVLPLLVRAGAVAAHVLRDAELISRCVPT